MLIEETGWYTITDKERVKRKHGLFVDILKIYQESHQKFEVVNKMTVKANMDTGACYGEKNEQKLILEEEGEELAVWKKKWIH